MDHMKMSSEYLGFLLKTGETKQNYDPKTNLVIITSEEHKTWSFQSSSFPIAVDRLTWSFQHF